MADDLSEFIAERWSDPAFRKGFLAARRRATLPWLYPDPNPFEWWYFSLLPWR
jgi:hypothetical protein